MTTLLLLGSFCLYPFLISLIKYLDRIKEKGGLTHITEHYACTAENIINQIPMKPDKILWASLLGGCRIMETLNW